MPATATSTSGPSGFATLDDQARSGQTGYTLVHCPSRVVGPVARHLRRQSEAAGRTVLCVDGSHLAEPWRELGRLLRVEMRDDPTGFARSLFRRIGRKVVVLGARDLTQWGGAVADQLANLAARQRFEGWIVELCAARRCPQVAPLALAEVVEPGDLDRWWQALWQAERMDGRLAPVNRLDEGERWWWAVRGAWHAPTAPLSADARSLLARLVACRRLVPAKLQVALGTRDALSELVERDLVVLHDDGSAHPRQSDSVVTRDDALAVASLLARSADPWDGIRAAELTLGVGELGLATERAEQVLGALVDPCARMDLWSRWEHALAGLRGRVASRVLQRFSELALRLGDVEQAFSLARQAAAHANGHQGEELLLCLGRAAAARGEHGAAAIALEAARQAASSDCIRAKVLVELAEIACAEGNGAQAAELAQQAVELAADGPTRLAARNVLGKQLLAKGAWREADLHFSEDAHEASCLGELEAQLRAELNQGTALVMGARLDAAHTKFQQVLDTATSHGHARASAFALSNLAVLAARRYELAEALQLRERSVRLFRRVGNRAWLGRMMIYLADLRTDLGLVDEAEQGLAFARRVLGQALRPTEATFIGYVACRIHLARQDTVRAATAIREALRSAPDSGDGTMLGECHCQAARVALADGDAARAVHHIAAARSSTAAPANRAELALLDAMLARLEGKGVESSARAALEAAERVGDGRRAAQAHRLLCLAASSTGDLARARAEQERAAALEEAISAGLPTEIGERCRAHLALQVPVGPEDPPDLHDAFRSRTVRQDLVGSHSTMVQLRQAIERIAPTDATVLVVGESGTGKELVADALHRHSRRRTGPFIKVNCAALVETLLLSELFGHEKGAFTGATSQHRGCFEAAAGGTLFLDEIGDISLATQAALLRVLQDRTFLRVGGTELVVADVRVVCATHRNLTAMMSTGRFREDLFYRLSAVVLEVPPLRERAEDIPLLCTQLLARIAREQATAPKRLAPEALSLLARQPWRGNVRELDNALRVAALFADGDIVTANDLRRNSNGLRDEATARPPREPASRRVPVAPDDAREPTTPPASTGAPPSSDALGRGPHPEGASAAEPSSRGDRAPIPLQVRSVEELAYGAVRNGVGLRDVQKRLELHCVVRALRETGGHVGRAAALLGIKRPRLSQLIKEYDLKCPPEES